MLRAIAVTWVRLDTDYMAVTRPYLLYTTKINYHLDTHLHLLKQHLRSQRGRLDKDPNRAGHFS